MKLRWLVIGKPRDGAIPIGNATANLFKVLQMEVERFSDSLHRLVKEWKDIPVEYDVSSLRKGEEDRVS